MSPLASSSTRFWARDPGVTSEDMRCVHCGASWSKEGMSVSDPRAVCELSERRVHLWAFPVSA